jgi:hypothetical protein
MKSMKPTFEQITDTVLSLYDAIKDEEELSEDLLHGEVEETLQNIGVYPSIEFIEKITTKFVYAWQGGYTPHGIIADIMWEIERND